jgi:pimeloyl-ACP methyl ester carboxylesterase
MALAFAQPDLLAGLIVADIAPVAYAHTHQPFIEAMLDMDLGRVTRRSDADPMLAEAVADPMLRAFLLQNLVIDGGQARWRLNLRALRDGMPALIGWPEVLSSARFEGPALFVYGGASDYMGSENEGAVRAQFPMASFEALAGTGHWLHAEKPAEFLAVVQGWLDRMDG